MNVEIYTLSYCPYCAKAKKFFENKGIKFIEYEIDGNEEEEFTKLQKKFNIKGEVTVPQIIIDGRRIGGYSDLMELIQNNKISF